MTDGNASLLEIRDLSVAYGNIAAVKGISFSVDQGEVVALIGANGAGKSSTLRALSGMVPFDGDVLLQGMSLRGVPAHRIVGMGVAHVPEGRGIFGNLTVLENLTLATWQRRDKAAIKSDFERIFSIFPRLQERRTQQSGTLSGGEQQMLAIARALMSSAKTLLLDEPSMGLSPLLCQEIFQMLTDLNRQGTTILLVEQNANMALSLASRCYVLETGTIVLSGTASELIDNPQVREAYLGA